MRSTIFLPVHAPAVDAGNSARLISLDRMVSTAVAPATTSFVRCIPPAMLLGADVGTADQAPGEEERRDHRTDIADQRHEPNPDTAPRHT